MSDDLWTKGRSTGQESIGIYACDHCPLNTLRQVFCEVCGGRVCVDCVACPRPTPETEPTAVKGQP